MASSGDVLSVTRTDHSDLTPNPQEFFVVRGFDKLHRLTRSVDNVGNTNLYAYDSRGNLLRHIDPNGNLTGYSYDGLNRLTLAVADLNRDGVLDLGVDVQASYGYDDNSRLFFQTDDNTNTTFYAYDSRDRRMAVTEADSTSCSLVWSPRFPPGRPKHRTEPASLLTVMPLLAADGDRHLWARRLDATARVGDLPLDDIGARDREVVGTPRVTDRACRCIGDRR